MSRRASPVTASEIVDFWFTHAARDSESYQFLVAIISDVLVSFKGERGQFQRQLAVESLIRWLNKRGKHFEAKIIQGTNARWLDEFKKYNDQLCDALVGRLSRDELQEMFLGERRMM